MKHTDTLAFKKDYFQELEHKDEDLKHSQTLDNKSAGQAILQVPEEKLKNKYLILVDPLLKFSFKGTHIQEEDNQLSTRRKLVQSKKHALNETMVIKKQTKKQSVLVDTAKTIRAMHHVNSMKPLSQGFSNSSKFHKKKVAIE